MALPESLIYAVLVFLPFAAVITQLRGFAKYLESLGPSPAGERYGLFSYMRDKARFFTGAREVIGMGYEKVRQ